MKTGKTLSILKLIKPIGILFFIIYSSYLVYLTLFSSVYGREFFYRSINIIPCKTIILFLNSSLNQRIIITNIFGNIAAFLPMGFLLPVISNRMKGFRAVFFITLAATFSVEIMQYVIGAGASDIDDVILNTAGGILGYLLYTVVKKVSVIYVRGKKQ